MFSKSERQLVCVLFVSLWVNVSVCTSSLPLKAEVRLLPVSRYRKSSEMRFRWRTDVRYVVLPALNLAVGYGSALQRFFSDL